jgi:hypothetical protein
MSIQACMFRTGLILVCLTSAWAQQPATYDLWLKASQDKSLTEIHSLLVQPNAPAWPELARVPNPLAQQIHKRIKELEGLGPPESSSIPARVRMYAQLALRFRAAHGYANYVLADSLQVLSVLHLARLVIADGRRASECSILLRSLDLPLLSPQTFQDIYQAKLGKAFRLEGSTQEAMIAALEKIGDIRDGLPVPLLESGFALNTGSLLTRANPVAFLLRLSNTDLLGRGALAQLIEFVQKGGRLADVNPGDVRNYEKLIPADYAPKPWGILRTSVGVSAVHDLIEAAGDPDATPLEWALDGPRRPAQSRFQLTEISLGKVEGFEGGFQMGISPDDRRFHVIVKRGGKDVLATGRGESRAYDRIGEVLYNAQSTRLAFVATKNGQQLVVLDGVESMPYDRIDGRDLRFSPDGRHFAFPAERSQQQFIALDGREIGPFEHVLGLAFSPDQQLVYAHMFRRNGRWIVVCGNHQSPEYPRISGSRGVTFSADGKTWAYQAMLKGEFLNIVEGVQTINYPGNGNELRAKPVFSADGRHVMFPNAVMNGSIEAQLVDIGDPTIKKTIPADKVIFSEDFRHWASIERTAEHTYSVRIDGREWQLGGAAPPNVHFSLAGEHFAIQLNSAGLGEKESNLLIDGNSAPVEHRASDFVFSPDGNHWAYTARVQSDRVRNIVVRDSKQIHSFSSTGNQTRLAFSPDNRHLAYAVAHGPMSWALAVDGEEAPPIYDFFPYNARVVFDSPNKLHTIAVRNGEVLLVELNWR